MSCTCMLSLSAVHVQIPRKKDPTSEREDSGKFPRMELHSKRDIKVTPSPG